MSDDANRWEPPVEGDDASDVFENDVENARARAEAASGFDRDELPSDDETELYDEPGAILTDEEIEVLAETPEIPPKLPLAAIVGGALLVLVLVLVALRAVIAREVAPVEPTPRPTAIRVIQPTFTPTSSPEPPAVLPEPPKATPSPTLRAPASPTPTVGAGVQVGVRVRIVGTEAEGVRFRTGPGVEYVTLAILFDGTELLVVGGPEESSGFTWWRVQDDDGTIGWIIADVLEPVR
ncbi:MAG: hypothetical protein GXP42_01665 [Chloroflexi bacterium]|nr:hypothetical protein [Chloroflexota bacterium]